MLRVLQELYSRIQIIHSSLLGCFPLDSPRWNWGAEMVSIFSVPVFNHAPQPPSPKEKEGKKEEEEEETQTKHNFSNNSFIPIVCVDYLKEILAVVAVL